MGEITNYAEVAIVDIETMIEMLEEGHVYAVIEMLAELAETYSDEEEG